MCIRDRDGPWEQLGNGGSSRLMIFELDTVLYDTTYNDDGTINTVNDSAIFTIEFEDNSWTNWSGYNISTGDLDNDGLTEIYTVAFDFYHVIVFENTFVWKLIKNIKFIATKIKILFIFKRQILNIFSNYFDI